jgi:hypothetical protein
MEIDFGMDSVFSVHLDRIYRIAMMVSAQGARILEELNS